MHLSLLIAFAGLVSANFAASAEPVAILASPEQTSAPARDVDPVAKLHLYMARQRDRHTVLEGPALLEMRQLVGDVRLLWSMDPMRAEDVATVLLDLAGLYLDASVDPTRPTAEGELRDIALDALKAHMTPALTHFLSVDVLSVPRLQPLERRLAAARLFELQTVPSSKLALVGCARDKDTRMRHAALAALVGWSDDIVHGLFLNELERAFAGDRDAAGWLAEKHFAEVQFTPKSRILLRYQQLIQSGIVSASWREASRAIALSKPLDNESIVPFLIEALVTWQARAETGAQSLRIRFELQSALRARSGRQFGMEAEDWRKWWALVRSGEVRGVNPASQGGFQESTRPSFFGIRPMSDRVVFVLDRSGSMSEPFGPKVMAFGEHRRWDEAEKQLLAFVEAMGPKAKFNVFQFHDFAESWKDQLVPATPENLRSIKEWLDYQRPAGGTELRAGVERAMQIQSNGQIDFTKLEADTVIVLCDGETDEGPGWVDTFLEHFNSQARIVFHGVQVGSHGDETLQKLARGSHGDFAKVDG
jgi:hypothetical protein